MAGMESLNPFLIRSQLRTVVDVDTSTNSAARLNPFLIRSQLRTNEKDVIFACCPIRSQSLLNQVSA